MPRADFAFRTISKKGSTTTNRGFRSEADAKHAAVIVVTAHALRGVSYDGHSLEVTRTTDEGVSAKRFNPADGTWSSRWYTPAGEGPLGRGELPFPVIYSAVGILTKGKEYGRVTRLKAGQLSRAIAIATAQRQKSGHVRAGSRELTRRGRDWVDSFDGEVVEAVRSEFERLSSISPKRRRAS